MILISFSSVWDQNQWNEGGNLSWNYKFGRSRVEYPVVLFFVVNNNFHVFTSFVNASEAIATVFIFAKEVLSIGINAKYVVKRKWTPLLFCGIGISFHSFLLCNGCCLGHKVLQNCLTSDADLPIGELVLFEFHWVNPVCNTRIRITTILGN